MVYRKTVGFIRGPDDYLSDSRHRRVLGVDVEELCGRSHDILGRASLDQSEVLLLELLRHPYPYSSLNRRCNLPATPENAIQL